MKTTLFSIYGARISKDGNRVNISIVTGEGDARQWGTISIKLNNSSKVKVELEQDDLHGTTNNAILKIPMLDPSNPVENDGVPF